jgi:hypothetical protein
MAERKEEEIDIVLSPLPYSLANDKERKKRTNIFLFSVFT